MQNAHNEDYSLRSYKDDKGVWTIGYGHQGRWIGPNMAITLDQAEALRVADLAEQAGA